MSAITIIGNIGEPTLRMTNNGKSILSFGLAVNRKVGDEERTTWFNVKAWNELADNLAAEITKGDRVIVHGFIENEKYTDKNGDEKTQTVIVASEAGRSLRWARRD